MKRFSDQGSSPLELVVFTALLILPLSLSITLYQQLSSELAAESIARHALRLAILRDFRTPSSQLQSAVSLFAANWGLNDVDYRYWCTSGCSLVTLEVQVGAARAIQTMGLPRN